MGPVWLHSCGPRLTSYCVALTLRRLCSTEPVELKKAKRGKKSDAKSKKQPPSSDDSLLETEAKKKPRKSKGEGKKRTQAELLADHVAEEPAAVQKLLHQHDAQLNRRNHDPETFYILNESIAVLWITWRVRVWTYPTWSWDPVPAS